MTTNAAVLGENWQQQIEEMLQPALASLRQQVVQAAEQQLEPLRSRLQQLAEQQLAGALSEAFQQRQPRQAVSGKAAPGGEEAQQVAPAQSLGAAVPESALGSASQEESALQRWGSTLEDIASILLAVGEVFDGIALILQAVDELLPTSPSFQREQGGELAAREEQKGKEASEEEESGEPVFQKFGHVFSVIASAIREVVSRLLGGSSSVKPGLEGVIASLPQWGRILEHASALLAALGENPSSQGSSSLKKWGPIVKHGTPLVKELGQVLGGFSSQQGEHGGGNIQRWGQVLGRAASVLEALGGGSSGEGAGKSSGQERKGDQQEQEKSSSTKQSGSGISSALQSLAGGSSTQKKDGEGSSLLDALTGEASPLQMLREFSKRQQGPGGLAPKGPVGRKPPPGPLRRDRIPDAG